MRYMPEADTFNFIAETPVHGIADEAIRYGNESRSLELNDNEVDTMGADSRMAREVR